MPIHRDAMVDIETKARSNRAKVIQIGAVLFDRFGGEGDDVQVYSSFKVNIDTVYGEEEADTLAFWKREMKSNPRLEECLSDPEPMDLQQGLHLLSRFLKPAKNFWCHGPSFDYTILSHHCEAQGVKLSIPFWNARCTRSFYDLLTEEELHLCNEVVKEKWNDKHDALNDCLLQTYKLQRVFAKLKSAGIESMYDLEN